MTGSLSIIAAHLGGTRNDWGNFQYQKGRDTKPCIRTHHLDTDSAAPGQTKGRSSSRDAVITTLFYLISLFARLLRDFSRQAFGIAHLEVID